MIYVTEHVRYLDRKPLIKLFLGVEASVSDREEPYKRNVPTKDYNPEDWRALLRQPNVMYRYRNEPFRLIEGLK